MSCPICGPNFVGQCSHKMTDKNSVDELFDLYYSQPVGTGSPREIFKAGYASRDPEVAALKSELKIWMDVAKAKIGNEITSKTSK